MGKRKDCCDGLKARWDPFKKTGVSQYEEDQHHKLESSAWVLLDSMSTLISVEMYFTCLGILLKVLLLTQHPNSEKIVQMDSHHHVVDKNSGDNIIVRRKSSVCGAALPKAARPSFTLISILHRASRHTSLDSTSEAARDSCQETEPSASFSQTVAPP